ncbi:Transcription factor CPH2 [Spathaspora sp. JA1]|nr:Transcription factor CPH2 [Spathaspora sp. JA1]
MNATVNDPPAIRGDNQVYFNFEDADEFLDVISESYTSNPSDSNLNQGIGDLNNNNINIINPTMFSPLSASGDEATRFNNYTNGQANSNSYSSDNNSVEWNDYISPELGDNNILNGGTENDLSLDQILSNDTSKRSNSTSSYYQDGVTPVTNPSLGSSTYTSPEPAIKLEYGQDSLKPPSKVTKGKKSNGVAKPKTKDKNSHNMIEKKYRTNINSKIVQLRDAVPSLRIAAGTNDVSLADLEGLTPASKLNKASVLTKATEYIKHLENKNAILKEQNFRLQRMIQEANLNPQSMPRMVQQQPIPLPPQHHPGQQPRQQPQSAPHGFGYYPNQQPFNSPPQQQGYQFMSSSPEAQHQPQSRQPNRLLLGGMAAVMGTSLFGGSGENDFRSLGALPFSHLLPASILNPSALTIQLWNMTKLLLVLGSLASLIIPIYNQVRTSSKNKKNNNAPNVFIDWLLITFGVKLPNTLSPEKRKLIISHLQGGARGDWSVLISDYFYLNTCEINFENCFLSLLTGRILQGKYTRFTPIINHHLTMKAGLLMNLQDKSDDKSLKKLNQLIGQVDGISMFGSEDLISRLTNLFEGKLINNGLIDGQNHIKYVELYQELYQDYYGVVLNWRLLEIIHQLNLTYLEELDQEHKQILEDLTTIEKILDKSSSIYVYFQMFVCIVDPKRSGDLFANLRVKVQDSLDRFKAEFEGLDLTDHEIYNTSDEENTDLEDEPVAPPKSKPTLRSQRSLVSSLGLINEEEYIILASCLIQYFTDKPSQSSRLLFYLKESESKQLTLLGFTALITLIQSFKANNDEDSEVLDILVKNCSEWLKDCQFMDVDLKNGLIKVVVDKGMIISGIEEENEDNE